MTESDHDPVGAPLVECVACGTVGLQYRIHALACPHDGAG
jgi:hypothetical protein